MQMVQETYCADIKRVQIRAIRFLNILLTDSMELMISI